ncbi:hypothetical protein [Porphyromonas cangingivalis]|uniref:hypothetical protein n=1 Tax=Porphyromonas cangingivalis TaxID=36874 RepID=UPI002432FE32|nr:hypothetical protein [Porphyromonas cangingivalis]
MNKFIGIRNITLAVFVIIVLLEFAMDFAPMAWHLTMEGIQVVLVLILMLILLPILIYRFNKGRTDDATNTFRQKRKEKKESK